MKITAWTLVFALLLAAEPASLARAAGMRRKVLGVVAQADRARIDSAVAQAGADIYGCDNLDTDEGGTLRVRVASGQVYLPSTSSALLEDEGSEIHVLMARGGVSFSAPTTGGLAVQTPAGIVRGSNGQAVAGEISLTGPNEMLVSAMRGDLLLDNAGELRTVPEGKSAKVTFEPGPAPGCRDDASADNQQVKRPVSRRKIGFIIVAGAAAFIPSYFIWRNSTESDSTPPAP